MNNRALAGLAALRIALGVFFTFEGLDKIGWLTDPSLLTASLNGWRQEAAPVSRWYLDNVAIPGAPVFARLVMLGQVAAGFALMVGVWTRVTAVAAFLMVLNFHFAHSQIFRYAFLSQGNGLPVLGGLLALALGGGQLPLSLGGGKGRRLGR